MVQSGILGEAGRWAQAPLGVICSVVDGWVDPAGRTGSGGHGHGGRGRWWAQSCFLEPGRNCLLSPPGLRNLVPSLRAHPLIVSGSLPQAGGYFGGLSENSKKNK